MYYGLLNFKTCYLCGPDWIWTSDFPDVHRDAL